MIDVIAQLEKIRGCLLGPIARGMIVDLERQILREQVQALSTVLKGCPENAALEVALDNARNKLRELC